MKTFIAENNGKITVKPFQPKFCYILCEIPEKTQQNLEHIVQPSFPSI